MDTFNKAAEQIYKKAEAEKRLIKGLSLEEIKQNRGTLYDSEVVDACVRLFTEKGFTFD